MGATSPTYATRYDLTPYNCIEPHSVEGDVPLFKLRGESLFLFAKANISPQFLKVAEQIEVKEHPHLCSFFGNLFKAETVSFDKQHFCLS
jgi:hypothetical protein